MVSARPLSLRMNRSPGQQGQSAGEVKPDPPGFPRRQRFRPEDAHSDRQFARSHVHHMRSPPGNLVVQGVKNRQGSIQPVGQVPLSRSYQDITAGNLLDG